MATFDPCNRPASQSERLSLTPTPIKDSGQSQKTDSKATLLERIKALQVQKFFSSSIPPAPLNKEKWTFRGYISSLLRSLWERIFGPPKKIAPPAPSQLNSPQREAGVATALLASKAEVPIINTRTPTLPSSHPLAPAAYDLSALSQADSLTPSQIKTLAHLMGARLGQLKASINSFSFERTADIPVFLGLLTELKDTERRLLKIMEKLGVKKSKPLEGVAMAFGRAAESMETRVEQNRIKLVKFLDTARDHIEKSRTDVPFYEIETYIAWREMLASYEVFPSLSSTRMGMRSAPSFLSNESSFLTDIETRRVLDPSAPLGIPNPGINACYRNSSNQCLRHLAPFRELLRQPITLPDRLTKQPVKKDAESVGEFGKRKTEFEREVREFEQREKIRSSLENLYGALEQRKGNDEIGLAEIALCTAMFESGLHADFGGANMTYQQDAAAYVELALGAILEQSMLAQMTRKAVDGDKTISSTDTPQPRTLMQIPMDPKEKRVQQLINNSFKPFANTEECNAWKTEGKSYVNYTETTRMIGDPPAILPLHFKRLGYDPRLGEHTVDRSDIECPPDDIVDFSAGYDMKEGSLKYKLQGFVLQNGSALGGHYTSYSKVNGKWYFFDDSYSRAASDDEVNRLKKKAYIQFFKRVEPA